MCGTWLSATSLFGTGDCYSLLTTHVKPTKVALSPEEILAPVQLGLAQSGGEQNISGGHRPLTKTCYPEWQLIRQGRKAIAPVAAAAQTRGNVQGCHAPAVGFTAHFEPRGLSTGRATLRTQPLEPECSPVACVNVGQE